MTLSTESSTVRTQVGELMLALRSMTRQSILLGDAIASAAGLNGTDLEALGIIEMRERTTPGDLVHATGLTSGAVTALVDRLERKGYIRRLHDPVDRRKVLLQSQPDRTAFVRRLYNGLDTAMHELVARYTAEEMRLLTGFLDECTRLSTEHVARISGGDLRKGADKAPGLQSEK